MQPQGSPAQRAAGDEILETTTAQVRRRLREGAARRDLLVELAAAGEALAESQATVSILVLDENGLLRDGASPNLPPEYLRAIDRLKPDPRVGTCAAAAATGCVVVTTDFRADDKWGELRHLPLSLGYVGAWSMPIKSREGTVLGTFGTYYRECRAPSAREQRGVGILAAAAADVLAVR
jgi:GAF domain-containing protein